MPKGRPRSITDDLATRIKADWCRGLAPRDMKRAHPDVSVKVMHSIRYGLAYREIAPVGPVRVAVTRAPKPNAASRAFSFSREPNVAKILKPAEREAYDERDAERRDADAQAEKDAREALRTEHRRQPYLVQLSVVVGLEAVEDEDVLAVAAELAARQVLGMRQQNRGWAIDAIERVR